MPTVPRRWMWPGMMPILHSPGVITPGQLGPISRDFEPDSARLTLTMSSTGMPSVMQTISGISGVDRFQDRVGGEGRRHIDRASRRRRSSSLRLAHRVEHRQAQMRGAAFAGRDAADHLGAVGDGLLGMEGALVAGEALADDLGVLVDEDGHYFVPFTALTIFCGGVGEIVGGDDGQADLARIFLPSSTLVPSSRTTSGT